MTTLASIAAAGLLARLCAAVPLFATGDVQIEGNVRYDVATGRVVVTDGAVLRRGAIVLRARTATYDPLTGEVRATGKVLLTDATHVVAADAVRAVLGGELEADGVVAFVKDQQVDLSRATTLSEARRLGRNRLTFSGTHLAGDPAGRFQLSNAQLTLCDCGEGRRPSWEVTARSADVIPGKRAILSRSVIRIAPPFLDRSVPVPLISLPWLYLPLGERQTGLLLPELPEVPASSFTFAQPVFITLGRSADATLTPEYFFGRPSPTVDSGAVRGPGARLELRWAPAVASGGAAHLAWVHDLERESVGTVAPPAGSAGASTLRETSGAGGDRFALDLSHAQRISERASLRAALRLSSDWSWVRDMTPGWLARKAPYQRSDVVASQRREDVVLEAGAQYLQPLLPFGLPAGESYGPLGADLRTASRWLDGSISLLPAAAGPLQVSGRAGAARFAPVSGAYDVARRPAADRADARLDIEAPLALGNVVSIAPYVRGAAVAYAFEAALDPRASAWGVAGAVFSSEVSRRHGGVRHAIAPRLEWRAGTEAAGGPLPTAAYDAVDRSATSPLSAAPGPFQQLRAAIQTRLERGGAELLRLEIGQDVDLRQGRFAETFGSLAFSVGRVSADAAARFFGIDPRPGSAPTPGTIPSSLDRFSELHANVTLADRRGDALRAGFFSVGPGGSGWLRAGMDPLFDIRPTAAVAASAGASVGVRVAAGPAMLGYDAVLPGRATLVPSCHEVGSLKRVEGWEVRQHVGSLAWVSRCRCFNLVASLTVDDCGNVTPRASIDLSGLAGVAGLH